MGINICRVCVCMFDCFCVCLRSWVYVCQLNVSELISNIHDLIALSSFFSVLYEIVIYVVYFPLGVYFTLRINKDSKKRKKIG